MNLTSWLDALEADDTLRTPARLRERGDVRDRLETALLGNVDFGVRQRAAALAAAFEAIDDTLYTTIRREIGAGRGASALREFIDAIHVEPGDGYDALDDLLSGVLQLDEPSAARAASGPDEVFYQPTPARHAFDLIRRTRPGDHDVLFDLGSGLGHVPLLVAACTTARCVGIECEPAYVDCAQRGAHTLGLSNATFLLQDASVADLSTGTIFYLYTPFTGATMRTVLDTLARIAGERDIRVAAYGPCAPIIARETWLHADEAATTDRIVIFRSRRQAEFISSV